MYLHAADVISFFCERLKFVLKSYTQYTVKLTNFSSFALPSNIIQLCIILGNALGSFHYKSSIFLLVKHFLQIKV